MASTSFIARAARAKDASVLLGPFRSAGRFRSLCTMASTSFIARAARAKDASVLLGPFRSAGRFDASLERAGMTCTAISKDGVTCELTVTEDLTNNYGTLHGGCISLLVDIVGTMALLGVDPSRAGVSVEMNQSFCTAAPCGDTITATGTVTRYGRTLGFTEVTLQNSSSKVVAVGRHTKFFPPA